MAPRSIDTTGNDDMKYRLDVVAPSVTDAVRSAGGWLFDRAMAGWAVTVIVDDDSDPRPLRILGVDTLDLDTAIATAGRGPRPHALAVAAGLYGRDSRVRAGVRSAIEHGRIDVTLWGDAWPSELGDDIGTVEHRLSVAARAFKAQALAAAALPSSPVGAAEVFRSGRPSVRAVVSDLVSANGHRIDPTDDDNAADEDSVTL